MMKTITLVGWRRPDYLREVIGSLRVNNTTGWSLVAVLDHGCDYECVDALRAIDFMPVNVHRMQFSHAGAHHVGRIAYERALDFGSDLNFALEDDTVLAPDALDLVNWWYHHHDGVLCAFNFSRSMANPDALLDPYTHKTQFNAWGWAARRKVIQQFLRHWLEDDPGWDISVRERCKKAGFCVYKPVLSRVMNVGKLGGAHYTPELFDEHFGGVVMSDGTKKDYHLI